MSCVQQCKRRDRPLAHIILGEGSCLLSSSHRYQTAQRQRAVSLRLTGTVYILSISSNIYFFCLNISMGFYTWQLTQLLLFFLTNSFKLIHLRDSSPDSTLLYLSIHTLFCRLPPRYVFHLLGNAIEKASDRLRMPENETTPSQSNPFPARMVSNQRVTHTSHFQDVRHIEFDITGSNIEWVALSACMLNLPPCLILPLFKWFCL